MKSKSTDGFCRRSYEQGRKLNGIIFLHRISDHRMGGVARKNFRLFRKLCGDDALKNVVIVTNMWGEVKQEVGESRECELVENELFFKASLEKGAHLVRHDNTVESAHRILREIMGFPPQALLIQRETVDEHKSLAQTNAGIDLQQELDKQATMHRKELDSLKVEMEEMMAEKDVKHQGELEELTDTLKCVQGQLEKVEAESKKISIERDVDRQEHEEQVNKLIGAMKEKEEEFRSLQENVQEHKRRIEQMEEALRVALEKAAEQELNRKKAEEDLKTSNAVYQEELERMRKDFEKKLTVQCEAIVRSRMSPTHQTFAQEQWSKVYEATRERRGIFGAIGVVVESIFGSGASH